MAFDFGFDLESKHPSIKRLVTIKDKLDAKFALLEKLANKDLSILKEISPKGFGGMAHNNYLRHDNLERTLTKEKLAESKDAKIYKQLWDIADDCENLLKWAHFENYNRLIEYIENAQKEE